MAENKNKFYVTTPIYYVTARPHLGSLYSTVLADVAARWHKLRGQKTFLLTGTDEHGQKVAQAAQAAGMSPRNFVDGFIPAFKKTWSEYHIDYNFFIRTTDQHHVKGVQQWIRQLQEQEDIYLSTYQGWYCTPCETFVAEATHNEHQEVTCPTCGRSTIAVQESCYFFRLSTYQDKLLDFYRAHPDFITPSERLQEVISFVKAGLKDLCLSRTTITWGIPFPGDERHVTYVWADALNNYITAIGYGDPHKQDEFNFWWPADLHVLGKDIVRFHAVYWPAFLMASQLALPKKLLVHGWIKVGERKMSKSFGNVVDPHELYKAYGPDIVRYYLTRHMAITQDSPFSLDDLEERVNAELADDLGNLAQRMISLASKHHISELQAPSTWSPASGELQAASRKMLDEMENYFSTCMFHLAYAQLWKFIKEVNSYFHHQEPWRVAKTDREHFQEILSATAHSLYIIAHSAWPVMPTAMEELLARIGMTLQKNSDIIELLKRVPWQQTFMLKQGPALFKKFERQQPEPPEKQSDQMAMPTITIDEFARVHAVVGTILSCESVPSSEKLYKLMVDCGQYGTRQILSGIKAYYQPHDLIGKQSIFVVNLKPRTMAGLESQGMLLTAKDEHGRPLPATISGPVPNGTKLQ